MLVNRLPQVMEDENMSPFNLTFEDVTVTMKDGSTEYL